MLTLEECISSCILAAGSSSVELYDAAVADIERYTQCIPDAQRHRRLSALSALDDAIADLAAGPAATAIREHLHQRLIEQIRTAKGQDQMRAPPVDR